MSDTRICDCVSFCLCHQVTLFLSDQAWPCVCVRETPSVSPTRQQTLHRPLLAILGLSAELCCLLCPQLQFPLQEFILAMGFFLVLVMEQITLAYKEQSVPPPREETRALLGTANGGPQHWHDGPRGPQASGALAAPSALRACVLVFSLALHSVFEGLAVGLQRDRARAMELCLALLLHKGILAVSLSLRLLQSHLRAKVVAGCGILFSCMTPLGIGLGAALAESAGPLHQLAQSVLEGMAAGTFLYITFLEILPQELATSDQRILKVILLLSGFALLTGLLFIQV